MIRPSKARNKSLEGQSPVLPDYKIPARFLRRPLRTHLNIRRTVSYDLLLETLIRRIGFLVKAEATRAADHFPPADQTTGRNLVLCLAKTTTSQHMPTLVETEIGNENQRSSMQYLRIQRTKRKWAKRSRSSCVERLARVKRVISTAFKACSLLAKAIG